MIHNAPRLPSFLLQPRPLCKLIYGCRIRGFNLSKDISRLRHQHVLCMVVWQLLEEKKASIK